jgi:hypothetical protein
MDTGLIIGLALIVAGLLVYLCRPKVGRDDRSVHIGGQNTGLVNTGNINVGTPNGHEPKHSHTITFIAIAIEVVGIGVTLWHAYHMMHK